MMMMKLLPAIILSLAAICTAQAAPTLIVVTGAAGESEYGAEFSKQSGTWKEVGTKGQAKVIEIGAEAEKPGDPDFEMLHKAISTEPLEGSEALWIVFNGHGTWDGKSARFNLRGPDVSGEELASWLKKMKRPLIVINASSSSAPFIANLAAPGRIVITATRSGSEQNFPRFGKHLADSLTDPTGDIDTDGSISLLEAFLAASRKTAEFYKTEGRLATEHALIEDNGDAMGTPAEWFKGLRATKKSDKGNAADGGMARRVFLVPSASEKAWPEELSKKRDDLEAQLAALREAKPTMGEDDYYSRLEPLMIELATLTAKAEGDSR